MQGSAHYVSALRPRRVRMYRFSGAGNDDNDDDDDDAKSSRMTIAGDQQHRDEAIGRIQKQIEALQEQQRNREKELGDVLLRFSNRENQVQVNDIASDALNKRLRDKKRKLAKAVQAKTESTEKLRAKEADYDESKELEHDELVKTLQAKKKPEHDGLAQKLQAKERENDKLTDKVSGHKQRLRTEEARSFRLTEECSECKVELAVKQTRSSGLEKELSECKERLVAEETKCFSLNDQILGRKQNLLARTGEWNSLSDKLPTEESKSSRLDVDLMDCKSELEAKTEECTNLDEGLRAKDGECSRLIAELSSSEKKLKAKVDECTGFVEDLHAQDRECSILIAELSDCENFPSASRERARSCNVVENNSLPRSAIDTKPDEGLSSLPSLWLGPQTEPVRLVILQMLFLQQLALSTPYTANKLFSTMASSSDGQTGHPSKFTTVGSGLQPTTAGLTAFSNERAALKHLLDSRNRQMQAESRQAAVGQMIVDDSLPELMPDELDAPNLHLNRAFNTAKEAGENTRQAAVMKEVTKSKDAATTKESVEHMFKAAIRLQVPQKAAETTEMTVQSPSTPLSAPQKEAPPPFRGFFGK
ncbi:hypothetical protein ST47_g6272 [Ascochyta rabiei]|uniref:Uncharacterized protein n=1 Tax=Didymella rabiei TaxID=5454 RepID=A0A163CKL7_DIDRA|nr:hypothetical protein ST47_g6272 [Ascochyta rabiei]